ncbi:MAG TPA: WGR domain-containing protein [Kofleriaceae bacterium]|nr:WGR domain-containing protein [Kofleriaceae bacterium]
MSEWTAELIFEEGTATKFWRARVEGASVHINYGRVGTDGTSQTKDYSSPAQATTEYGKLVADKRRKGYVASDEARGTPEEDDDDDEIDETADAAADDASAVGADIDADEVDDEREPDDEDEDDIPVSMPRQKPVRLVLEKNGRHVETYLILDRHGLRTDTTETFANPGDALKAFQELEKSLLASGYKKS